MPAYAYSCDKHRVQRVTEEQRRVADTSPPPKCPTCRREMVPYIATPPTAIVRNPAAGWSR